MITLPAFNRINSWFFIVVLTAISFTWSERLSSIGIVLLSIHWVMDRKLIQKVKTFKLHPTIILCWSFFLIHLISLWQSEQMTQGWQSVEVKLSLLLLPFFFSTENYFNSRRNSALFSIFTISCVVSFTYTLIMSWLLNYHNSGWAAVLNRMSLSEIMMHPGYYSNYFALSLVWCVFELLNNHRLSKPRKIAMYLLTCFMLLVLLILISRTAMLFIVCLIFYFMWRATVRIRPTILRVGLFVAAMLSLGAVAVFIPSINFRVRNTLSELSHIDKNVSLGNSTGSRVVAWKSEWILIQQHWLKGYGTGEANYQLNQQLLKDGYIRLASDEMHTHNQFFHTWIDTGLIGILLLLTLLIWSGLLFLKRNNMVGIWLICLIVLNCLTDDMLEIQAGIVFFVFFLTLFLYQKEANKYGPGYL